MPEEKKQQNVEDIFSSTETMSKQSNIFKEIEPQELSEEEEISEVAQTFPKFIKQKNKKIFVIIGVVIIILILFFGIYTLMPKIKEIKEQRKIEKNLEKNANIQLSTITTEQLIKNIDSDKDGLSNQEEAQADTNPLKADTDNDGLSDRDEVKIWKTDPLNPDTDDDRIKDGDEIKKKLNPNGKGTLLEIIQTKNK